MIGGGVDVFEEEEQLIVEVALPGVRLADVSVNVCGNRLLLWAQRPETDGQRRYRVRGSRLPSHVSHEVVLPREARVAEARGRLKNGVLRVCIPLCDEEGEAVRPIPVSE